MNDARPRRVLISAGLLYALVGVAFAWPGTYVQAWRLAAWVVSAAGFALHIGYERFVVRSMPVRAAWRVALGAGLGAFGLAVAANIHSLQVGTTAGRQRALLLFALAAWPLLTGVPAFLVALAVSFVLARLTAKTSR